MSGSLPARCKQTLVWLTALIGTTFVLCAAFSKPTFPSQTTFPSFRLQATPGGLQRHLALPPFVAALNTDARLKMLHYIDKETFDSLMDRWFARSHDHFSAHSSLVAEAVLWGSGFPGWNDSISLSSNVENRFGRVDYFDAILPYYNGDQVNWQKLDPAPRFLEIREFSLKGNTVVIDRPHEMRDKRRVPIIDLANVSIVLCPYANECFDYRRYAHNVMLVHQPHSIDVPTLKHPIRNEDGTPVNRPRDVFLAGSLEYGMYPLRHRLGLMIGAKKIPGEIRNHPGYPDIWSEEKKKKLHIDREYLESQLIDFSRELAASKICFVTSSRWGYSVQKYGEAAAAGCLIIGTIPYDRQLDFRDFVVEISNQDKDEDIIKTIKFWLDPTNEEQRLAMTEKAQKYFVEKFSGERYVEDVVRWIRWAKEGRRGLVLPYEWEQLPKELPMDG